MSQFLSDTLTTPAVFLSICHICLSVCHVRLSVSLTNSVTDCLSVCYVYRSYWHTYQVRHRAVCTKAWRLRLNKFWLERILPWRAQSRPTSDLRCDWSASFGASSLCIWGREKLRQIRRRKNNRTSSGKTSLLLYSTWLQVVVVVVVVFSSNNHHWDILILGDAHRNSKLVPS